MYQGLNLDDVGDADDEVYVSVYEFGDYEDNITVMRIHLGTGETMAKVFPVYGRFSLQTGRLFSENKDALILEIENPTSNYGAADIFVLDVFALGRDPFPSTVVRLDTTTIPAALSFEDRTLHFENITSGTKLIDIEGMPLQGLEVYAVGPEGNWQEIRNTLCWTEAGWSIISGK